MPDRRQHRGPHPEDARLFAAGAWPALRTAVADVSWLLSRTYAAAASLKLVSDRFSLAKRQRVAVMRAACSDAARDGRAGRRVASAELAGAVLLLDGYNVLTTVEAAFGGAVVLGCRDGTFRDMAGMHGTYRKVRETVPALVRIGEALAALGAAECRWYFDSPVSNSGRLRGVMRELAAERTWPWTVELVPDPDRTLCDASEVVAMADSAVLDRCGRWVNLAREIVSASVPGARVVELASPD